MFTVPLTFACAHAMLCCVMLCYAVSCCSANEAGKPLRRPEHHVQMLNYVQQHYGPQGVVGIAHRPDIVQEVRVGVVVCVVECGVVDSEVMLERLLCVCAHAHASAGLRTALCKGPQSELCVSVSVSVSATAVKP